MGVYGVVSYSVQRRHAEYGIRLALGAEPRRVLATVLRRGLVPVVVGIVAGTLTALLATRLLAGFLFQVPAWDPVSMGTAAAVLLASGVVAALVPALRAAVTDPAAALRSE